VNRKIIYVTRGLNDISQCLLEENGYAFRPSGHFSAKKSCTEKSKAYIWDTKRTKWYPKNNKVLV